MKSFTSQLSGSATMLMFPLFFLWQKRRRYIVIFIFPLMAICSCYQHYFRTKTIHDVNRDMLQNLQSMNKYIIIHYKDGSFALNNISLRDNIMTAEKVPVSEEHTLFFNPDTSKINRVKKSAKQAVLMEVHLYTDNVRPQDNNISIPVADIKRADIYTLDKGATNANHVISTVGVVIVSAAVIGLIALAIACNCPQVYVENNNGEYNFNGGMYSGAVYASLERTDFMPLGKLAPENNILNIKINNAPGEEQFINQVYLVMADHTTGSEVLADRHGKLFSFNNPVQPVSAINNNHTDIKKMIDQKDGASYGFNDNTNEPFSSVFLTFKKNNAKNGRLIIKGKNSLWSGYIYKNFNSLFGEGMEAWRTRQDKADPVIMDNWLKVQKLPLMVYLKKDGQWVAADYFSTPGNTFE
ncbi:MAG TPA: hypothetical protein VK498_08340, partial [Ferruginibacter sp.]|nr:hypothetical protein [Ferruginibacter sp.]